MNFLVKVIRDRNACLNVYEIVNVREAPKPVPDVYLDEFVSALFDRKGSQASRPALLWTRALLSAETSRSTYPANGVQKRLVRVCMGDPKWRRCQHREWHVYATSGGVWFSCASDLEVRKYIPSIHVRTSLLPSRPRLGLRDVAMW